MSIVEVRLNKCFSIRARAEPPRPLDCNKHFCANRVVCDRARRGGRAHEEAEGGSAPSNHVARWYNHLPRSCASSSCCGNMLSGIMSCACLRDHLGGLVSPVGRTVKREGNVPTQYDHGEGSEGLESHVRRSERFFFPRRLLTLRRGAAYQQSGPTTSDMAERFTGPYRECMEWLGLMVRSGVHFPRTGRTCAVLVFGNFGKPSTPKSVTDEDLPPLEECHAGGASRMVKPILHDAPYL